MPRIRTIKPEFPQSESMGRVSRDARLCFLQLWTLCDDAGRARGNSRMLASLLFPYDDDAKELIDGWLAELEREGCIQLYQVDGDSYFQCTNWLKHQKIDKPSKSKIPSPPEISRTLAKPREHSSEDQGSRIKEGTKDQRTKDVCAEPLQARALEIAPTPFLELPTNRKDEAYLVTEKEVLEYGELYPAVDVRQEIRKMRGWLIASPTKRKTARGMARFITSWLSKQQDKGHENDRSNGNGHAKRGGITDVHAVFESLVRDRFEASGMAGDHAAIGDASGMLPLVAITGRHEG